MSRKRGEFEHRTSIFEGAFRAWSHLGGLDLADLQNKSFSDLDPLNHPIEDDSRLKDKSYGERGRNQTGADPPVDGKEGAKAMEDMDSVTIDSSNFSSSMSQSGSKPHQRVYPYEPLPRTGTSHPFVKAIISPWLGDNATGEQKQLGLTTLRTWWQHRRKGESVSAIKELGTDKMRVVVEGYTRWFFQYAHNCVTQGMEHPPRTLATKIKEAEKRSGTKIMFRMEEDTLKSLKVKDLLDLNKKPKENIACCSSSRRTGQENSPSNWPVQQSDLSPQYGDPNKTPVVFISANGDIQIALKVKGITCGNCVKIIETVLKGVNGRKTPIPGLVDAAADRELSSVLIKLEKGSDARRVAFEAGNNLIKVGYESQAIEMGVNDSAGRKTVDMNMLVGAFAIVANTDARDVFDWSLPCTCPDNGVVREDCPRHSQMNKRIFEAFETRQQEVTELMAGCGTRLGMDCSCGTNCKCKSGACSCGRKSKTTQPMVQSNLLPNHMLAQRQLIGNTTNASLQGIESFRTPAFFQNNINAIPGNVPSLNFNDSSTPSFHHQNQQQQSSFLRPNEIQFLLQQQQHQQQQQQQNVMNGLPLVSGSGNELNPMIFLQQAQQQQQQQSQMQQELHGDNSSFFPSGRSTNDVGIGMNGLIGQNANIAMMAQAGGTLNLNGSVPPDFNHNNMMGFVNAGRMNQMEQWNSNLHNASMEDFVETDV